MTQKDKELLLKDLCARLPYGVKATDQRHGDSSITDIDVYAGLVYYFGFDEWGEIKDCKPYLRPMSSITDEENKEFQQVIEIELKALEGPGGHTIESAASSAFQIDFYNKHHIDYRGLIPMGLALEAKEGMYKNESL